MLFYIWKDARVWAHWNHSSDSHLSFPGPVFCVFTSWVPSECIVGAWVVAVNLVSWWLQHPLFTDMAGIPFCCCCCWYSLSFCLSFIWDRKNDYFLWAKKKKKKLLFLTHGWAQKYLGKVSRILSYHTAILYKAMLYVFMLNSIIPWLLFHVSEVYTYTFTW